MSRQLNYFQTRSKAKPIAVEPYLKRIGLTKEEPSLAFLKKIHKAHLLSIPFENLDIHYGPKILMDIDLIFEKVVHQRRGGFCYELNALLYHLLSHLGFECFLISANVKGENNSWGPDFDHMAVVAKVSDKAWLLDVGFGKLFVEPKPLTLNTPLLDYNTYFKFEVDPDDRYVLKKSLDNSVYESVYKFDLKRREFIEFLPMCNYHQESEKSHFTQKKLITQLFRNGRITLTDRKIRFDLKGDTEEKPILNEDEFLSKLEHHFGINSRNLILGKLK
ncbi:MAG: arylamine N-acetyltransferase [Cyclobacteriaceae bacterium]